jgi:hypothetical protein
MKKILMDETSELTKHFQKVSDQLEHQEDSEVVLVVVTEVVTTKEEIVAETEEVLGADNIILITKNPSRDFLLSENT